MKLEKSKSKISAITFVLLLTFAAILVALPSVSAHDPPIDIPTYAYLVIAPNPVGAGQTVYLIAWLHGAPPTAAGIGGDRYLLTVEATKPNGDVVPIGSEYSDPTGSTFFAYTPDAIGDYEVTLTYDGQVVSLYHPVTGIEGEGAFGQGVYIGDNMLPSSATVTLEVQEEQIARIQDYDLPSEYWNRPIDGQNSLWDSLGSSWLRGGQISYGYGAAQDLFQRNGDAPDTAHIMWTMPTQFGGITGGNFDIDGVGYYSGGSYEGRFANSLSMYGRLYFNLPLSNDGNDGPLVCVDMRTGEILWQNDEITPSFGQIYLYESINQHGVINGYLWETDGDTWHAYDAFSGAWLFDFTNVPGGTATYTNYGEIENYILDYENRELSLWTSAALPSSELVRTAGTGTNAYQYRPIGKEANMSDNYRWTVDIPALPGAANPSIVRALPGDLILGVSTSFPFLGGIISIPADEITMWALNLNPDRGDIGELLWIEDYPTSGDFLHRTLGPLDPEARVFTMSDVETFNWFGFNLDTGAPMWGPKGDDDFFDFQYYGGGEGGGQKGFAAYGNLYVQGFGGEIHCYDMANGNLLWEYNNTNSGVETIWGNYPIFMAGIADGKVYVFNNEHSPNYPLYKGEKVRALSAFDGAELWTLTGWAGQTGGRGTSTAIIADGFLAYYNYYDNQVYCIGKGASKTTVTASPKVVADGSKVLIEGTVTDQAPGATQDEQAKRFPNGVPAVSDASMSAWMEYVYMQKPCPESVTGVQVTLTAIDPNGVAEDIGTATTDAYGMFKKMWTPEGEGEYTIIATFEGTGSFYYSYAETALGVGPAVSADVPIDRDTTEPFVITTEIAIIAAVAVAVVVGIVAFWALRKRK